MRGWVLTLNVVARGRGVVPGREIGRDIVEDDEGEGGKDLWMSLKTVPEARADFEYFHLGMADFQFKFAGSICFLWSSYVDIGIQFWFLYTSTSNLT